MADLGMIAAGVVGGVGKGMVEVGKRQYQDERDAAEQLRKISLENLRSTHDMAGRKFTADENTKLEGLRNTNIINREATATTNQTERDEKLHKNDLELQRLKNKGKTTNNKNAFRVTLKTGGSKTETELQEAYDKEFPLNDYGERPANSPSYTSWVNEQAVKPVYVQNEERNNKPTAAQIAAARKQTEKDVEAKSGFLETKNDFVKEGGKQAYYDKRYAHNLAIEMGQIPKEPKSDKKPTKQPDKDTPKPTVPGQKLVDPTTVRYFLNKANGDTQLATKLAREAGYTVLDEGR